MTWCFTGLYHQTRRSAIAGPLRTSHAFVQIRNHFMSWQSDLEHCLRPSEPLAPHCWLRLGGPAEYFAEPTNDEDLQKIVGRCKENNIPLRVLGGGSNLLINDDGIRGVVVSLAAPAFGGISVDGDQLTVGGGAQLSHAIVAAVREGLAGLESLVSVPGTVGGALHGNAGDRIASVGSCFREATVMTRDGQLFTRDSNDVAFAYRKSGLDELAIVRATFKLEEESKDELARRMQKQWIVTRSEQPTRDKRTACLFKDPMGQSASDLIQHADLRGHGVGGASLFERDPNYVVVAEEGTYDDVRRLMDEIGEKIELATGVELERSLQVW